MTYRDILLPLLSALLSATVPSCFSAGISACGQDNVRIYGTVKDAATGEPLPGAVILRIPENGSPAALEYAVADSNGEFSLFFPFPVPAGDSLRVSYIGYSSLSLVPEPGSPMAVELRQRPLYIKEVTVTAPKVKLFGDTVSFNVQSFAEEQDRSISDVIRRMPGMEVKENGAIYYNGKEIGGLYVEGEDISGGRYSMVTENLSAQLVKSVEVMERHQPVKALRGLAAGEKPSLNLKLQEKAKGAWVGSSSLSGGVSSDPEALWDARLFIMRIGRRWQSISNLKSNNTGVDIGRELFALGDVSVYGSVNQDSEGFISVGTENAPLKDDRVRLNASAMFNTVNSIKVNEDWKVKLSAYYSFDRLESENASSTVYYFEDGKQAVSEGLEAMTREHAAGIRLETVANTGKYYLGNTLSGNMHWRDALQAVSGDFPNVSRASLPYFSIGDSFRYVLRSGGIALSVCSDNSFTSHDQALKVLRENASEEGGEMQVQNVDIGDFSTDTYLNSDFRIINGLTLAVAGGFSASARSLRSDLSGIYGTEDQEEGPEMSGDSILLRNDLTVASVRPYISPSLVYESRSWEINLSVPLSYVHYTYIGKDIIAGDVSAKAKYMPWPKLSFALAGNASLSQLDIKDFYTGYIMKDYRYLVSGTLCGEQDRSYSVSASVNYKDPVNMFYLDGTVSRSWNVMRTSVSQDFLGNYIVIGSVPDAAAGDMWMASVKSSAGIYGINGKVSADLSYTGFTTTSMVMNGERTPYVYHTVTFRPSFSGRLCRFVGLDYRLDYSHLILAVPGSGISDNKDNFSQTLSLAVTPVKSLDVKISAEHYYATLSEDFVKNTVLADLSVIYRLKNRMEITLSARNILNAKTYAYSIFDSLTEFSCEYRIRPLNVTAGIYIPF